MELPPRLKTHNPDFVLTCNLNDGIKVDYPTERILLNGISFDYVTMKDGYMEPVAKVVPSTEVHVFPSSHNEVSFYSNSPLPINKDELEEN